MNPIILLRQTNFRIRYELGASKWYGLFFYLAILFTLWSGTPLLAQSPSPEMNQEWSDAEIAFLYTFSIRNLPPLPPDPSNRYADDPLAAALGHKLFFDTRFSQNGTVACATCHNPNLLFTDAIPLARGIGTAPRHTPSIVGTAYSPWLFWDGRKDSQWSQALGPLENPVEHGSTRTQLAKLIAKYYRADYEAIFGFLPDMSNTVRFPDQASSVGSQEAQNGWKAMAAEDQTRVNRVFANIGKAIAAYERKILLGESRFDQYVEALTVGNLNQARSLFSQEEVAGLRIFMSRGNCTQCHMGPLFTNNSFHNIGVPDRNLATPDLGRFTGALQVIEDEFNCLSPYSDAQEHDCAELKFIKKEGIELIGAFRPPSLRNVSQTSPYMHAGQFSTLSEVLAHYNQPKRPEYVRGIHPRRPHSDLVPLNLSNEELKQLEAFLRTLNSPLVGPTGFLKPPESFLK